MVCDLATMPQMCFFISSPIFELHLFYLTVYMQIHTSVMNKQAKVSVYIK